MVSTIVHSQVNDLMNNPQFKEVGTSQNEKIEENSNINENLDDSTKENEGMKNLKDDSENEKSQNVRF